MATASTRDPRAHVAAWLRALPKWARVELASGRDTLGEWPAAKDRTPDALAADLVDAADAAAELAGRELHVLARAYTAAGRILVLAFRAAPPPALATVDPARPDPLERVASTLMAHVAALTAQNHSMGELLISSVKSVSETQAKVLDALTQRVQSSDAKRAELATELDAATTRAHESQRITDDAIALAERAATEPRGSRIEALLVDIFGDVAKEKLRAVLARVPDDILATMISGAPAGELKPAAPSNVVSIAKAEGG